MSLPLVYEREGLMNGKAQALCVCVCVLQFITSLLISSGQIVQYLTLIYFYGGGSSPVCVWGRDDEKEANSMRMS